MVTSTSENGGAKTGIINKVRMNYMGFIHWEVLKAAQARHLQEIISSPSACDFSNLLCNNIIENCSIKNDDLSNADKMFSPDIPGLRGKIV